MLCSYVLGGVFRYSIKNNLITTYNSCNELFQDESGDLFENGDLFGQIKNPQDAVVMIVDSDNGKLYTSINDEGQMMEGMRSLMNSIRSEDNESQFGTGEYIIRRNHDTITNADYYDLIGRLNNGYEVFFAYTDCTCRIGYAGYDAFVYLYLYRAYGIWNILYAVVQQYFRGTDQADVQGRKKDE